MNSISVHDMLGPLLHIVALRIQGRFGARFVDGGDLAAVDDDVMLHL